MALSLKKYKEQFSVADLTEMKKDSIAFFRQNMDDHKHGQGNMGKWTYSTPQHKDDPVCGGILWDLFVVLHPHYYPKRNQISLIQKNISWLKNITNEIDSVLDFGCGGSEAIQDQTIPILSAYTPRTYIPIDICDSFVDGAKSQVLSAFGNTINVISQVRDFLKPSNYILSGRKLGLFFGASTNFESFPHGMLELFKAFKNNLGPGGYIALSIDTNIEERSVVQSYDHPIHGQQLINLFHRLKRDFSIMGDLDPMAWKYETDTESLDYYGHKVLLAKHVVVSQKDQSFSLDDEEFFVRKGERLVMDKSYKISVSLMNFIATSQGYEFLDVAYDDNKHMALVVYKVK